MSWHRSTGSRSFIVFLALVLIIVLASCAQRAKTLQVGASQFDVEVLAAIEKIDELRRMETKVTPLAPSEVSKKFVELVEKSSGKIDNVTLDILIDPLDLNLDESDVAWQSFLAKLRWRYTNFTAIFISLDKASLFATPSVKETIPLIEPLIGQMVAFAEAIRKNPAKFVRERVAVATDLESIRDNDDLDKDSKQQLLLEQHQRLLALAAKEKQVTSEILAQCLKSVRLGMELRKLLEDYDKLNVDGIAEGMSAAFKFANNIPGLDLADLKADTELLVAEIKADDKLKGFFDSMFISINKARPINLD